MNIDLFQTVSSIVGIGVMLIVALGIAIVVVDAVRKATQYVCIKIYVYVPMFVRWIRKTASYDYKDPKIYYVKRIPIFRAFGLPYLGIVIEEKYKCDALLLSHEKIHLKQIHRMTLPVYLIRYVIQLIFIGYDTMPIELEARQNYRDMWNYRENNWVK